MAGGGVVGGVVELGVVGVGDVSWPGVLGGQLPSSSLSCWFRVVELGVVGVGDVSSPGVLGGQLPTSSLSCWFIRGLKTSYMLRKARK
jgi:hypothetical protein